MYVPVGTLGKAVYAKFTAEPSLPACAVGNRGPDRAAARAESSLLPDGEQPEQVGTLPHQMLAISRREHWPTRSLRRSQPKNTR